ncbi:UNVERIFIED_CONTAM: Retrovirus-related Pol polyprotein from transposon TNT 1-94 [Sesamum angustifolium]|uniref:Retrovirus-related Pol polyprotein from transposon TNT 1-94 n=1 Tax=Sesamum angustifolium TaxID=2727405 RepID=A0AAW2KVW3_9LAMI
MVRLSVVKLILCQRVLIRFHGLITMLYLSLVAKIVTVRLFLALAVAHDWPLHQIDVNNAFLHGYLDKDLYIVPPEGYSVPSGLVCKLECSIYSLKQAHDSGMLNSH